MVQNSLSVVPNELKVTRDAFLEAHQGRFVLPSPNSTTGLAPFQDINQQKPEVRDEPIHECLRFREMVNGWGGVRSKDL